MFNHHIRPLFPKQNTTAEVGEEQNKIIRNNDSHLHNGLLHLSLDLIHLPSSLHLMCGGWLN